MTTGHQVTTGRPVRGRYRAHAGPQDQDSMQADRNTGTGPDTAVTAGQEAAAAGPVQVEDPDMERSPDSAVSPEREDRSRDFTARVAGLSRTESVRIVNQRNAVALSTVSVRNVPEWTDPASLRHPQR